MKPANSEPPGSIFEELGEYRYFLLRNKVDPLTSAFLPVYQIGIDQLLQGQPSRLIMSIIWDT